MRRAANRKRPPIPSRVTTFALAATLAASAAHAQQPRALMPIEFENSAEFGWLQKPVLESRVLDDMSDPSKWALQGTGTLTFHDEHAPNLPHAAAGNVLRVDMQMFHDTPAPTRNRLSTITLRKSIPDEDWSAYNRISLWIRPSLKGFPMLPLQIVLHNQGRDTVPDRYYREGIHYVTLKNGVWQQVVWEITPLARDRVTALEFGYWVNKLLAAPGDRVAFEIGPIELQRVEPDHYAGWDVAPGRIAYSHTGYRTGYSKTALASDLDAVSFQLVRVDDTALGDVVYGGPVESVTSPVGTFQVMDFSAVNEPGRYVVRAGGRTTRPFAIGADVWRGTTEKALNFLYGQRCGFPVPGSHGVDHEDWFAVHNGERIVMNGGWHDAGDLSQGAVNTGETVYALFALAERLQREGGDPALLARVVEEATWGLDWLLKVRFDGGYRIGFAGHNLWTNNVAGDADDREREALNNPNVNYIAAAAEALAYRVLKDTDPERAARALRTAEADWRDATTGYNGPETWTTPAYAASPVEIAGIGVLASLELFDATGEEAYAERAVTRARDIVASQQVTPVGTDFPLAGFFWEDPTHTKLFHQFHRGNDQAPLVALARLLTAFPSHDEADAWRRTVSLYLEYQKTAARYTGPWGVLPAYVYREADAALEVPDSGALHGATREAYVAQVREGLAMGDGWYLRAFPVWFARRGNYGVLLSQTKALAAATGVMEDSAGLDLVERQLQWVVGRNPFVQSTLYGEGYDWAQQYAVSSGDFVGALPVGMQSHGVRDVPYWPSQNMYVYKEVWVHPVGRWVWVVGGR